MCAKQGKNNNKQKQQFWREDRCVSEASPQGRLFPLSQTKKKKKNLKAHYCTGKRIISPWMDYVAVEGKLLSLLLCMCPTGLPAGLHEDGGRQELCFLDRL